MKPTIGVLALQGAFTLRQSHIEAAGGKFIEVRNSEDLKKIDGLILPGGESSTMLKLLDLQKMTEDLKKFLQEKPAWGICAGAILMAKKVLNPSQFSFNAIDIEIVRNSYGRQLESQFIKINNYEVSLVRAPKISNIGKSVKIFNNGLWVENELHMITTFHPETNYNYPSPWHQYFVQKFT